MIVDIYTPNGQTHIKEIAYAQERQDSNIKLAYQLPFGSLVDCFIVWIPLYGFSVDGSMTLMDLLG